MASDTAHKRSAWVRRAVCLAALGMLSACINADSDALDGAPAWLQDDHAVVAPALDDA